MVKLYNKMSDDKWKNHVRWEHYSKTLPKNQFTRNRHNRYYHRGSSPYKVGTPSCCDNYLKHNRKYGNTVLSRNNPYADDNPGFSDYVIFSIFGDRVLSKHDIRAILKYYNTHHIIKNPEKLYGPFIQRNLNISSETKYNEDNWNQSWKGYHHWNNLNIPVHPNTRKLPVLYQVAHTTALEYMKAMNRVLVELGIRTYNFHLAGNKIISLSRSKQTEYIKYVLNVILIRNTKAKMYVFEVSSYYNPYSNKLYLGKSIFIGSGTTDAVLLPKGKDPSLFDDTGRPLFPLEAKKSELMSEDKVNNMFWQYLYDVNHYKQYFQHNDDLPFWHKSRHGKEVICDEC